MEGEGRSLTEWDGKNTKSREERKMEVKGRRRKKKRRIR